MDNIYKNKNYICRCPYCQVIMSDFRKAFFCSHCGVYIIKDTGVITYNAHEVF